MNINQIEWIELLQTQNFPNWQIKPDEEDVLIIVPNDQDLVAIRENFADTLLNLKPKARLPNARLNFVVGNNKTSFGYILNPDPDDLEARM